MTTSRRSRSAPGTRRKGKYLWTQSGIDPNQIVQDQQSYNQLLSAVDVDVQAGATVTRIVGNWGCRTVQSDINGAIQLGIVMMGGDAMAAGVGPELQVDEAAYLYRETVYIREGDVAGSDNKWQNRTLDTAARRKIRSQYNTLTLIMENISSVAVTIEFQYDVRILLYLP